MMAPDNSIAVVGALIITIALFLIFGNPVTLLQIAGAIDAAHILSVTGLILYLNRSFLPDDLRPSRGITLVTAAAGRFFAVFAAIYIFQLI